MNDPNLESILKKKYNIDEKLLAEGRFVSLLGNSKHATSLVNLGIGQRCFVVAKVILNGDVLDYELISLTPLAMLSFAYNDVLKMLKVRCKLKATRVYQLCSSESMGNIWDNFTTLINELGINKSTDIWIAQSLNPPPVNLLCSRFDNECAPGLLDLYPVVSSCSLTCKCIYGHQNQPTRGRYNASRSSSLPAILPSETEETWTQQLNRRHSMGCVDIKFDHFVNDAPTRFSEYSGHFVTCSWTGSADDLVRLSNDKMNVSNNPTNSSVSGESGHSNATKSKSFLSKLKGLITCCQKRPTG